MTVAAVNNAGRALWQGSHMVRSSWCVLVGVVLGLLAGCTPTGIVSGQEGQSAHLVYDPTGTIMAVRVVGGQEVQKLFVWEWTGETATHRGVLRGSTDAPVLRLTALDLATREPATLWEMPCPSRPFMGADVAVSEDGRVALGEWRLESCEFRVVVGNVSGPWTPIMDWDGRHRVVLRWSPDGSALAELFVTYGGKYGRSPITAGVMSVGHPPQPVEETVLTPPNHASQDFAWASDGGCIYHVVTSTDGTDSLEAVDWPSLTRRHIVTAARLGHPSVAANTGDVVFLLSNDAESPGDTAPEVEVWRLTDDDLEKTQVRLKGMPMFAVVSPDGAHLAVSPQGSGLAWGSGITVYTLADGTLEAVAAAEGKPVDSINWVSGGQALLFAEYVDKIWLVEMNSSG